MRLLYTVSSGYMAEQQNVSYSLGGFASSTTIPNDMFGNLFDELSVNTIRNARNEYRAIVLHNNDSQETAKDVKIWFENPETNVCSFKVGAVGMMEGADGSRYMGSAPNIYSRPYVQFYEATEENPVSIGDIQPDQMIGIWVERSIDKEKALEEYNKVAERDLATETRYKPIQKETQEMLNMQFYWE